MLMSFVTYESLRVSAGDCTCKGDSIATFYATKQDNKTHLSAFNDVLAIEALIIHSWTSPEQLCCQDIVFPRKVELLQVQQNLSDSVSASQDYCGQLHFIFVKVNSKSYKHCTGYVKVSQDTEMRCNSYLSSYRGTLSSPKSCQLHKVRC